MGEIGKIVKTVKVEDLPEDVRWRFKAGSAVTTIYEGIVDPFPGGTSVPTPIEGEIEARRRRVRSYMGVGKELGTTTEEAVARIRALRDEWD